LHISKKTQRLALGIFIILCPIVFSGGSGDSLRIFQEKFFELSAIALISLFLGNIWITSFLLLNVFLYFKNDMTCGGNQILNILLGSLLFLISRKYFHYSRLSDIRYPILILCAITLFWMCLQLLRMDPVFFPQSAGGVVDMSSTMGIPLGSFGLQAANGTFLLVSMIFIAMTNPVMSLLVLFPIALSKASGVYLATITVVMFYIYHLYRKLFLAVGIASLLIFCIMVFSDLKIDPKTFTSRFPMWHAVLRKSVEKPFGYGPDSFRNFCKGKNFIFNSDNEQRTGISYKQPDGSLRFIYYSPTNNVKKMNEITEKVEKNGFTLGEFNFWDNPHNEYIKLLFEYGILGIVILIGLMRDMITRFKSSVKSRELVTIASLLLVYFVSSLSQFPLGLARTAYLFPIFLGAFYAVTDKNTGDME